MSDSQAAVYVRQILKNSEKVRTTYKAEYAWDIPRIRAILILASRLLEAVEPDQVESALSVLEAQL